MQKVGPCAVMERSNALQIEISVAAEPILQSGATGICRQGYRVTSGTRPSLPNSKSCLKVVYLLEKCFALKSFLLSPTHLCSVLLSSIGLASASMHGH